MSTQGNPIKFKVTSTGISTFYKNKQYRPRLIKMSLLTPGIQTFNIFENAMIEQFCGLHDPSINAGSGTISSYLKKLLRKDICPSQPNRELHWLFKYKEVIEDIQFFGRKRLSKKDISEMVDLPMNEIGAEECSIEGRIKEIFIILDISNNTKLDMYTKNSPEITSSKSLIPIKEVYLRYDKSTNMNTTLIKSCTAGYITNLERKRLLKNDTITSNKIMEFFEGKLFVRNQYETNHLNINMMNIYKLSEFCRINKIRLKIFQNNKRKVYVPEMIDLIKNDNANVLFDSILKAERRKKNYIIYYNNFVFFSKKDLDTVRDKILDIFLEVKDTNFIKLLSNASSVSKENISEDKLKIIKKGGFIGNLYPQQIKGFNWIKGLKDRKIPGAILADEMGAGKTVQAIAFLSSPDLLKKKVMIICPASVVGVWENEILKFNPEMAKDIGGRIIIQSFEKALRGIIKCDLMIIDESQRFKNKKTAGFKNLSTIKTEFILMLSGTPIENSLQDLFSLLELIDDSSTVIYSTLKKITLDEFQMASKIKKLIDPILLQRNKSKEQLDVKLIVKDIKVNPNKNEINMYHEIKEIYGNKLLQLQAKDNHDFYAISQAFVGLTRLRQSVSLPNQLPSDLVKHFSPNLSQYANSLPSKFVQMKKILKEKKAQGEKTIVFTLFTETRNFIVKSLRSEKFKVLTFGGGDSPQKRKDMINAFQNKDYDVFVISLKSGNSGITLTAANNIIMYDLWWNSAVEAQAFARAHRIGQTKDVTAYRLITQKCVDVHIDLINSKKKELISSFNDGSSTDKESTRELVMNIFGLK